MVSNSNRISHPLDWTRLVVGFVLGVFLWVVAPVVVAGWAFLATNRRGKWELLIGAVVGALIPTVAVWVGFTR